MAAQLWLGGGSGSDVHHLGQQVEDFEGGHVAQVGVFKQLARALADLAAQEVGMLAAHRFDGEELVDDGLEIEFGREGNHGGTLAEMVG